MEYTDSVGRPQNRLWKHWVKRGLKTLPSQNEQAHLPGNLQRRSVRSPADMEVISSK